jgi:hypothetical protein
MATKPRIPEDMVAGFTMLGTGGEETLADMLAIPAEMTHLAGIPVRTKASIQTDPVIKELIRILNAQTQGCTY